MQFDRQFHEFDAFCRAILPNILNYDTVLCDMIHYNFLPINYYSSEQFHCLIRLVPLNFVLDLGPACCFFGSTEGKTLAALQMWLHENTKSPLKEILSSRRSNLKYSRRRNWSKNKVKECAKHAVILTIDSINLYLPESLYIEQDESINMGKKWGKCIAEGY